MSPATSIETMIADGAPADFGDAAAEERTLVAEAGMVPCFDRAQLSLSGEDRASFLHNLSSNDIKKLRPGEGCEAFLLNAQGKTLGHVYAFAEEARLVLDSVPGRGEFLLSHLDRYLIREKVTLAPLADQHDLLLAGARVVPTLAKLEIAPLSAEHASHLPAVIGGVPVAIRKVDLAGAESWLMSCPREGLETVWNALQSAGVRPCGQQAYDAVRIAAGTPVFDADISEANLPQEVNRDARAISFTKGCYIGQETVARIDALGHVNRLLVGLRGAGRETPGVSAELVAADGKPVGAITSVASSHRFAGPIALGYVRRPHVAPGTELRAGDVSLRVTALPME